ncbi:Hypothetical protein I5071_29430 [Sandaracinus amylolyticus]|nr:Hypothetical protein I5071_29430 [Sandaracinus amylolyticus]
MDLALSRLRVPADETPGSACPRFFGGGERAFCADDDAWRRLATQFAGALIPPILLPAHTRGMRGIYFGVESSISGIDSSAEYWARGTEGDSGDRNRFVDGVLAWSRFNVRKGLPFGFEIGTNIGFLVNTSYWALGAEVRWSLLEGLRDRHASAYFPSLSVRGSVQTLLGDPEVNVTVPAIDVSIGERIIVADTVEVSPYLGGQVAWVFADSELVDLTPEVDAFHECNPDPIPPGEPGHTGSDEPPYCRGSGTDFNHNVVFPSLRSTRVRLFAGSQVRYEWFALTAAFSFDLLAPSDLDESLPSDLPRQWRVDVGAGVSY